MTSHVVTLGIVILKPNKALENSPSYRPISLLWVSFKMLKKLIYAHVVPIIDPLLPREQVGFQRGRSNVDQLIFLTQEIEESFLAKKKTGAVFVDLTAAYDTVWQRGLTCRLLPFFLSDRHMVLLIIKLVCNQIFALIIGTKKQNKLCALRMASLRDQSSLSSFLTYIIFY